MKKVSCFNAGKINPILIAYATTNLPCLNSFRIILREGRENWYTQSQASLLGSNPEKIKFVTKVDKSAAPTHNFFTVYGKSSLYPRSVPCMP